MADKVGGRLHNGDPLRGCGCLADQRVPAVIELLVYFGAEQGGVFELLPAVANAVAPHAHPFEFVVGRVKDIVTDIHFLVPHHLGGSEIDEWYCHGITTILYLPGTTVVFSAVAQFWRSSFNQKPFI